MSSRKAYLVARAVVANPADREPFDSWYEAEHLPLAKKEMRAETAWRFWSRSDVTVHYAVYQFPSLADAVELTSTDAFKGLLKHFDKSWSHIPRTRDLIENIQIIRD